MSFVKNISEQISFEDSTNNLTKREKRILDKSWAKDFAERIFPLINENNYSALYSDNAASRPNTPVNIIIGALVLKEIFDLTDDEVIETLMFDIRYQYALHTTSFEEQPLSDRTFSRFRLRCCTYETETGIDLIHETIKELAYEMASIMKINHRMKRMDSIMVASNIKKLGRLELLYTCVSNLATRLHKLGHNELLAGLENYYDPTDYNRMIYHNRSSDTDTRIEKVIADALKIRENCNGGFDELSEYQLLLRVLNEQTVTEPGDAAIVRLRRKEDGGMGSSMLQNPSDPDATYREKSGKQYRGYVANVEESVDKNGSIIVNYQYEQNNYDDSRFLNDTIETMGFQTDGLTLTADGSYASTENRVKADQNNIKLITTNMTGRKANDIYAEFKFTEDGRQLLECAAGKKPKSCSYIKATGQCRVSFNRSDCVNCPHKDKCKLKIHKRTAVLLITKKTSERAALQRQMHTDEYLKYSRFRNGVESIPSVLRRKYGIDKMPVRGKLRTKLFFGFKIAALNFRKLLKFIQDHERCLLSAATT